MVMSMASIVVCNLDKAADLEESEDVDSLTEMVARQDKFVLWTGVGCGECMCCLGPGGVR